MRFCQFENKKNRLLFTQTFTCIKIVKMAQKVEKNGYFPFSSFSLYLSIINGDRTES